MRIGFVGLGSLGRHLAASVARGGFALTIHDRDPTAATALVDAGAAWADTPAVLGSAVDVAITCLPSPAAVAAVVEGENGLLAGLAPGTTWIDCSTNDRHELLRLVGVAEERGVRCLEAPVTGGVHKAAAGEITVLVGGDDALVAEHRAVLEALGTPVLHIGPLGSASVIKVITNMLAFIHLVATGEALMLARRAGLDLAISYEAIKESSGTSFVHETEGQLILNGSYDIGFTMDLALKDLGFASELAQETGTPLELEALVERMFVRAREAYGGSAQSPMVVKLLEDALGTDLRAPGFPARLE